MDCVQTLERFLKGGTQLVEQCCLIGKDRVTAAWRRLDHAEKSVGWRVELKGMIPVVFGAEMVVFADIPTVSCSWLHPRQRTENSPSPSYDRNMFRVLLIWIEILLDPTSANPRLRRHLSTYHTIIRR